MASHMIATAEEIRAIFDRAVRLLDEVDEEDDGDEAVDAARQVARGRVYEIAQESFRFCSLAAGALGDPAFSSLVIDAMERLERFYDHPAHHQQIICDALTTLLAAGAKVDGDIRTLAGSEELPVRLAVARGLRPTTPAGRALLEQLLHDPVPTIRQAARTSLASVAEPPWWTGKWKSDPAARLLPTEIESAGPALRRAGELLDLPAYSLFHRTPSPAAELADTLAALPDELAIEAAEQLFHADDMLDVRPAKALFLQMITRPGGVDAFDRLVDFWAHRKEWYRQRKTLADIVAEAPRPVRLAICRRCLERVLAAPPAERYEISGSTAYVAATFAGDAWPPGEDLTPLLDTLLSADDTGFHPLRTDSTRMQLAGALTREDADPTPVLDRLVAARLAGHPGPWGKFSHAADVLLARAPHDVLRRTAEQALHSQDPATLRWAAGQLLGPAHDPATDGSLRDHAATLAADPRIRNALLESSALVARTLPALRAHLRRGELSHPQAVRTFEGIDALYGGLAYPAMMARIHGGSRRPLPDLDDAHRRAREAVEPFLAPPDLAGPPTEEEWDALRRAYDAATAEPPRRLAIRWLETRPEGPWSPEDRAILDRYLAACRSGEIDDLHYFLAIAIASKPAPDMLPLLDELARTCDEDSRRQIRHARSRARAIHGLPPPEPTPGSAAANDEDGDDSPGDEWNDDDEHDPEST